MSYSNAGPIEVDRYLEATHQPESFQGWEGIDSCAYCGQKVDFTSGAEDCPGRIAPFNHASSHANPIIADFKRHMLTLIYDRDDRAIKEAEWWLSLLWGKRLVGTTSIVTARKYGFTVNTRTELREAVEYLERFVLIFGGNS